MAYGIDTGSGVFRSDRGLSDQVTPRILAASFGDGYEQRLPDGLNTMPKNFTLVYATRPKADIDTLVVFFESKVCTTAFEFIYDKGDGAETAINVVAPSWSRTSTHDNFYSLSVQVRQVYQP